MNTYCQNKLMEWDAFSSSYQNQFIDSNEDPSVIAEFARATSHFLRAPWVLKKVQLWVCTGEYDKIDIIFKPGTGQAKGRNRYKAQCICLEIYIRMKHLTGTGMSTNHAIEELTKHRIFGRYFSAGTIRNRYYAAKNQEVDTYVEDRGDVYFVVMAPVLSNLYFEEERLMRITFGYAEFNVKKSDPITKKKAGQGHIVTAGLKSSQKHRLKSNQPYPETQRCALA